MEEGIKWWFQRPVPLYHSTGFILVLISKFVLRDVQIAPYFILLWAISERVFSHSYRNNILKQTIQTNYLHNIVKYITK